MMLYMFIMVYFVNYSFGKGVLWKRLHNMDNKFVNDENSKFICSKSECALICASRADCQSFFFDITENNCFLHDAVYDDHSQFTVSNTTYYTMSDNLLTSKTPCAQSYTEVNDTCFRVYETDEDKVNWTDSRARCQQDGGDLIIIDSQLKHNIVTATLSIGTHYFIGIHNIEQDGTFEFVDGRNEQNINYTNWKPGALEVTRPYWGLYGKLLYDEQLGIFNWVVDNGTKLRRSICEIL